MKLLNNSHPASLGSSQAEWSVKCYMPRWCKKQIRFVTSFVALTTLDDNIQFRSRNFNHDTDGYGYKLRPKSVVLNTFSFSNKHPGSVIP